MGNAAPATKTVAQVVLLDGTRSPTCRGSWPRGRRVIANVERVAILCVTKNVMSLVIVLATALVGLAFPFLPRQMTLLSTFVIGIPWASRRRSWRWRPTTSATRPASSNAFSHWQSRPASPLERCPSSPMTRRSASATCHRRRSRSRSVSALAALLRTFFWLLFVLARPYAVWKVALIAVMASLVSLAFLTDIGNRWFQILVTKESLPDGLVFGAFGALVVEVACRLSRRFDRDRDLVGLAKTSLESPDRRVQGSGQGSRHGRGGRLGRAGVLAGDERAVGADVRLERHQRLLVVSAPLHRQLLGVVGTSVSTRTSTSSFQLNPVILRPSMR
jgi:cation-transporting ATPase E